jgi:hypothetical protein
MRWLVASILVVDVVAVHGHAIARLPVAHRVADLEHDTGGVRPDHVIRQRVARPPARLLAQPVEEQERRQRLEDRRPHRVEVDGARHHRDVRLVRRKFRRGHVFHVKGLAGVFVGRLESLEHGLLFPQHERTAVGLGDRQRSDFVTGRVRQDRVEDLLHEARSYRWVGAFDQAWTGRFD